MAFFQGGGKNEEWQFAIGRGKRGHWGSDFTVLLPKWHYGGANARHASERNS